MASIIPRHHTAYSPISKLRLCCWHPYMHKAGRVVGTREVVVTTNFLLLYKVEADRVDILNVLHSRQAYP